MKFYPGRLNFLLLTLAFCSSAFAQMPYNRLYGTYATETGKAGFMRSDSTIYALGTSSAFTGLSSQVYLLKTDKDGNLLWSRFFGGAGVDDATDMYYHTDTSLYLVASSYQGPDKGYDIKVIKTDMNGIAIWEKNYGTTDWDIPSKIVRISDSSFAVCGQTYGNTIGLADGMIFAFDQDGDSLWFKNLGTVYDDMLNDLVLKNADTLAAGGETYTLSGIKHAWLTELNLSTLSAASYTYGTAYNYTINAMEQMPGGSYVTGLTSDSTGNNDMYIWKIHPNNHTIEQNILINTSGNEFATDIVPYNSEYLILGNTTAFGLGGYDPVVFRYDTLGGWFIYGYTFGTAEDDYGNDLFLNNNGTFAFVGTSPKSFGPDDLWIVNVDNTFDVYDTPDANLDPNNVADLNAAADLVVYPNPCQNEVYLRTNLLINQVVLFDNTGRAVKTIGGNNLQRLDLSNTGAGIYQLVMTTYDGVRIVRQLAVK